MCQFHWELDCVGFSPFEIWRCGCVEMMRGIGGEGFLFSILGYRRGIARVSPEICELSCFVLSCRCCCYCCYCCCFCWSCCCCCCCLPSHYRAACATRGCTCVFGWSLHFDCSCGETCVPSRFFNKIIQNNLKS